MARHLRKRPRHRIALSALTATATAVLVVGLPTSPVRAETCSLSGSAFVDANLSGTRDPGEQPRVNELLYVFDDSGAYVLNARTDANGHYATPALACGTYVVQYSSSSWWAVRDDLTPTTTGSLLARKSVSISGAGTVDFGWRPIIRSTTAGQPLDTYVGPEGLRVESYDDVVPAKDVYDAALRGAVGAEARDLTIRFDLVSSGVTSTSITHSGTQYDGFQALTDVDFVSWLDTGDKVLSHEYGHAWSLYRAYLLQQDPSMQGYLQARGLTGDPRVNSTYSWYTNEMVAEDYRQLLGSATARSYPQTNTEIPPAASVPGLREYLVGAFSSASGSPSPSPTPSASPSPAPTASPSPSLSATAGPARTKAGGSRRK
jgi:hypothetical protein